MAGHSRTSAARDARQRSGWSVDRRRSASACPLEDDVQRNAGAWSGEGRRSYDLRGSGTARWEATDSVIFRPAIRTAGEDGKVRRDRAGMAADANRLRRLSRHRWREDSLSLDES